MGRSQEISGNVLLRRTHYRWADDEEISTRLARRFIAAKIINSRSLLHRTLRDHANVVTAEPIERAMGLMAGMIPRLEQAESGDVIRGIEGEAANVYFSNFNQMLLAQKETFRLNNRNRRPPTDPINALLSFLYTLLAHEVGAALESVGLDPQVGFLHRDRPGRASLALDLMEELRPHFC